MPVFTNGTVHTDVKIDLHTPADDPEYVTIIFGEEQLTLEFYHPDVLDRLAALATEGAQRLRALVPESDDRPRELAG